MVALDLQTARELKLIREQTSHCTADLGALRRELVALRTHQTDLERELSCVAGTVWEREKRLELGSYVELGTKELKACQSKVAGLEKELQGQKVCQGKVAGLEKELQGQGDQLDALRQLVQHVEPEPQPSVRELRAVLKYDLHQYLDRKLALQKISVDREREESCSTLGDRIDMLSKKLEQAAAVELLGMLEQKFSCTIESHGRQLLAAAARLEQLHGRLAACEAHGPSIDDLGKARGAAADEALRLQSQQALLADRLTSLEGNVATSADRSAMEAEALRRVDAAHERNLDDFNTSLARQAAMAERVDKDLDDLAKAYKEEMATTQAMLTAHASSVESLLKTQDGMRQETSVLQAQHASAQHRIDALGEALADLTKLGSRQSDSFKEAHAKTAKELQTIRASQVHLALLADRLDKLESSLCGSLDGHTDEIAAAKAGLDRMLGRITACEAHGTSIGDLRSAHETSASTVRQLEVHRASLQERMDSVEGLLKVVDDSAGRTAQEVEAFKATQGRRIQDLGASAVSLAACHTAFAERLDKAEKLLAESAKRSSASFSGAKAQMDRMQCRLSECEGHGPAIRGLKLAQSTVRDEAEAFRGQHALLREKLEGLERQLGDDSSRHSSESEALKRATAEHSRELQAIWEAVERLGSSERSLGDATCKHERELAAALARLEQLGDRLLSCEAQSAAEVELKGAHLDRLGCLERGLEEVRASLEKLAKMRGVIWTVSRAWKTEVLPAQGNAIGAGGGGSGTGTAGDLPAGMHDRGDPAASSGG